MSQQQRIAEGATGAISSILLNIPAWMLGVEFALKIFCLLLSAAASIFTIYKMYKKKR
jgi:hypothetical protein